MDAINFQPTRNGLLWVLRTLLLFLIAFGSASLLRAQPTCDCASTEYFIPETLPFASLVTSCPEWPATTIPPPSTGRGGRGISVAVGTSIPSYRGELYLSEGFIPYAEGSTKTIPAIIKGQRQDCQERARLGDQALGGWTLIILNRWYTGVGNFSFVRLQGGLMAAMPGNIFYPLEESEAALMKNFFHAHGGTSPTVSGIQFAAYPSSLVLNGGTFPSYSIPVSNPRGSRGPQPFVVQTNTLIADIQNTLAKAGWEGHEAGLVRVNGVWMPAVLRLYGKKTTAYAYYGRFTDASQARRYGHSTSDQLYFSKREMLPSPAEDLIESDMRYGGKIFSREDVLAHKDEIEWHSECRCSDMPFNPDERNEAKLEKDGNWTPISPNNLENSNLPLLKECPDQRTYFTLYKSCVEEMMADDKPNIDLRGRVDYSDYVASKMGRQTMAFKSYNPDGTVEGVDLSTGNMPETPAYYDHQGARLNPTSEDFMDPLDANTVFFGYRHGPKSLFDWVGPKTEHYRISPLIKTVVQNMQSLYDTKISQGKDAWLSLLNITFARGTGAPASTDGKPLEGPVTASGNFQNLDLSLTVDNPSALDLPLKLLNPTDKYLEYKSARTFIMQSLSGHPFSVRVWDDAREWDDFVLGSDLNDEHFQVYWTYGLFAIDKHGDPTQVGTLRVSNNFWVNSDDDQQLEGAWMDQVHMEGGKLLSSADTYNLNSREAHTDLKSLHDRDPETFEDKGDAMAKIAFYIAVSEGLDMAMKWIYDQRDKPYIYEAAKRVENMVAVKQTAKLAYAFYKGYVEWKRLMDILAEIRDSRRALERAYSRFKRSGSLLVDYYVGLDYSKIRPTNVAMLYPTRAILYFDWSVNDFQNELLHFEAAFHALNLDLDRFMDGPGKRTLAYLYRETAGPLAQVTAQNDKERERTHAALQGAQGVLNKGSDNTSNYLRLSALTRLALEKTRNTQVKSLEASTSGLRNVLVAIQSDSRDWLTMQDYLTLNLAGSPGAFTKAYRDQNPEAVAKQFDVHPIFRNPWVDDHAGDGP